MNDYNQNNDTHDLLDFPADVRYLRRWTGIGRLRWHKKDWECRFALAQLLNGRLRIIVEPESGALNLLQRGVSPLEIEGDTENSAAISIRDIHFTHRLGPLGRDILVGYAGQATLQGEQDVERTALLCEISNYSLHQRRSAAEVRIDDFEVTIERRNWSEVNSGVTEHATAYRHAGIWTQLAIRDISIERVPGALNCLDDVVSLLSIACRGLVAVVTEQIQDSESGTVTINLNEPPFPDKSWGQPLVPSEAIEEFLNQVYPGYEAREERLELAFIIDHYLQALTLRSIWPQSIGIYTAMETLKSAYFRRNPTDENAQVRFWVPPFETFESNEAMLVDVIETLAEHYKRFSDLNQSERDSLKAQISGLNRRSYRTLLKRMLSELGVQYEKSKLQPFLITRNLLIHEGTPVSVETPLEDYDRKNTRAWENVRDAISLFEECLLAFLNYSGPRKPYNEVVRSVN